MIQSDTVSDCIKFDGDIDQMLRAGIDVNEDHMKQIDELVQKLIIRNNGFASDDMKCDIETNLDELLESSETREKISDYAMSKSNPQ